MNRDESRHRPPELPPVTRISESGVRLICPRDSLSGGTWIGLNDYGVVSSLLNGPPAEDLNAQKDSKPSRGRILPKLLERGSWKRCRSWVEAFLDPSPFAPFVLVALSVKAGQILTLEHPAGRLECFELSSEDWMMTSSYLNRDQVLAFRRHLFNHWRQNGRPFQDGIPLFHLAQEEGRRGFSPLMRRRDSLTFSITQVALNENRAKLRWWRYPSPDLGAPDKTISLRLALSGIEVLP